MKLNDIRFVSCFDINNELVSMWCVHCWWQCIHLYCGCVHCWWQCIHLYCGVYTVGGSVYTCIVVCTLLVAVYTPVLWLCTLLVAVYTPVLWCVHCWWQCIHLYCGVYTVGGSVYTCIVAVYTVGGSVYTCIVVCTLLVAVYTPVLWLCTPPPTPIQIPDRISIGRCEKETICAPVRCWFLMGLIRTLNTQSYMYILYQELHKLLIIYIYMHTYTRTCMHSAQCMITTRGLRYLCPERDWGR